MVRCCVPHCKSTSNKKYNDHVSYHEFPSDLSIRFMWLKVINRKDFVINDKSNSSVVCSKHFKKEDYIFTPKRRFLKKGAIPSIFPYHTVHIKRALPSLTRIEPKRIKNEILDEGEAAVEEDLSGVSLNSSTVEPSPMELNSSIQKEILAVKEDLSGVPINSSTVEGEAAVEEDLSDVSLNSSTVEPSLMELNSSIQKEILAVKEDLTGVPINSSTVEPSPFKTSSIPEKKLMPREIVSTKKDLNGASKNSSMVNPSPFETSSIPEKKLTLKDIVSSGKDLSGASKNSSKVKPFLFKTYSIPEKKLMPREIVSTKKDLNGASKNSSMVNPSPFETSSIPEKKLTLKDIVSSGKDVININVPIKSPLPVVKTYHILERKLAKKEKLLALLTDKLKAKTLEVTNLKRKVYELEKGSSKSIPMKEKLQAYSNKAHHQNLEKLLKLQEEGLCTVSQDFILTQFKYMFSKKFHWPEKTLRECILLHTVSPEGYSAIMERNLVTLPSRGTLSRYTGPIVDESRPSTLKIRTQAVNSQPVGDLGH